MSVDGDLSFEFLIRRIDGKFYWRVFNSAEHRISAEGWKDSEAEAKMRVLATLADRLEVENVPQHTGQ